MANAARKSAAALAMVLTLAAGQASAGNEQITATEQVATIVVHVANHAGVNPDVLAAAMDRVAFVYKGIGVRTEWDDRGVVIPGVREGAQHFNVLIVSRDKREKTNTAMGQQGQLLGYAHLPSGRAYVFFDHIVALAGPPPSIGSHLGDVIAHEVGHLVLRTREHSSNGIMRPSLGAHAVPPESFNGSQARTIRAILMASR
jgi:hypothetical protein